MFWLEKGNRVSGFFYSTAVDIEDTAKKSKDQSCISTGTENNSCSDKCGGILEKRTISAPVRRPATVHPITRRGRKTDAVVWFFVCFLI